MHQSSNILIIRAIELEKNAIETLSFFLLLLYKILKTITSYLKKIHFTKYISVYIYVHFLIIRLTCEAA